MSDDAGDADVVVVVVAVEGIGGWWFVGFVLWFGGGLGLGGG
jgi:hypothetical protein